MQIEEGKTYRNKSGVSIGPMEFLDGHFTFDHCHYSNDGKYAFLGKLPRSAGDERDGTGGLDLIVAASPVRTVTRKEIVYGVFGSVLVNETGRGGTLESVEVLKVRTPSELRAAAATLIEIADALESQQ